MFYLKKILENPNFYKKNINLRRKEFSHLIDLLLEINKKKITLKNKIKKSNKKSETSRFKFDQIKIQDKLNEILKKIPNIVSDKVPRGKTKKYNKEIKISGGPKKFNFRPLSSFLVGKKLNMINEISGKNFPKKSLFIYKYDLAFLRRSLINFVINSLLQDGIIEISSNHNIKEKNNKDVLIENFLKNVMLDDLNFPVKLLFTSSYTLENSSLYNLKEDVIELITIDREEKLDKLFHFVLERIVSILEELEMPYRLIEVCAGELELNSMRTIDLEIYLPGKDRYRKISSVRDCGDYLSYQLALKIRKNNKNKFIYPYIVLADILNIDVALEAILENYQNSDGSLTIPRALRSFMENKEVVYPLKKSSFD